jgi:uncharacterized membrane protein
LPSERTKPTRSFTWSGVNALVVFALFNIMNVAFIFSVIGANLVWPIALYSSLTFAAERSSDIVTAKKRTTRIDRVRMPRLARALEKTPAFEP